MIAANPDFPYPLLDGRYVIDCSKLPEELRLAVKEAKHLNAMAEGSRRMADRWEREGTSTDVVEEPRKLADAYERSRDLRLAELWTFHGTKPPALLRLDSLLIIEG